MNAAERRLIEDYLPVDALNAIAGKEKLNPRHYVSCALLARATADQRVQGSDLRDLSARAAQRKRA